MNWKRFGEGCNKGHDFAFKSVLVLAVGFCVFGVTHIAKCIISTPSMRAEAGQPLFLMSYYFGGVLLFFAIPTVIGGVIELVRKRPEENLNE